MSYHIVTLTISPSRTIVFVASNMELAGLPMMSLLTIGSVLYSIIPYIGPSAAARMVSLISSTEVFRAARKVRSVIEPSGTGTRSA